MSQNNYPDNSNFPPQNQNIDNSGQSYNTYNNDQNYLWQENASNSDFQDAEHKHTAFKFVIIMAFAIILLIIAIISLGIYYSKTPKTNLNYSVGVEASKDVKSVERVVAEKKDYRPYLGNINAQLVIVEFGDFQCIKCQEEYSQIRQAVLNNENDVLFIFRHFPVIDENSTVLAKAGACADEQKKFWQFHDKLFLNFGKITSTEVVKQLALQSGMDLEKFSECLTSERYNAIIEEDVKDAKTLGVIGTPTFFINGNKLEGTISASDWEQIISKYEEILKGNN